MTQALHLLPEECIRDGGPVKPRGPEVEPAVPRANTKRVQDGVVCVAYVPGRVACAVLSMTGAGVHFN